MLLTSRKLLQRKLLDVECDLRGTLRNFGLKVGRVSTRGSEARIRELVEDFPKLAAIVEPLLTVRRVMRQQFAVLHKMLLDTVRHDPVCRRLMTAPGVVGCTCEHGPRFLAPIGSTPTPASGGARLGEAGAAANRRRCGGRAGTGWLPSGDTRFGRIWFRPRAQ